MKEKIFFFALLVVTMAFPVAADTEWDSATFILSLENPVASKGDYTIGVVEFDGYGMVALDISCNGSFIGNTVLMNNDSNWFCMDNDRIRLKGINVTDQRILPVYGSVYSPQAEFVFATKRPLDESKSLALSISTDKDEYLTNEQVTVTVQVRNIGRAKVDDIHLNIDPDGLVVQGDQLSGFSLEDGTYRSEVVRLSFPPTLHKGSHNISVNISWTNAHGNLNFLTGSSIVSITQPIELYKSTTNEVSQGQTVYTSISVENIQSRPVSVRLDDALPIFFTLIDGTVTDNKQDLNWNFILAPHERKVVSYQMIPQQVGAHQAPKPHVTWNMWGVNYTNSSNSDNIIAVYQGVSFLKKDFPDQTSIPDNGGKISMSVIIGKNNSKQNNSIKETLDNPEFEKRVYEDTNKRNDMLISNYSTSDIYVTANLDDKKDVYSQAPDVSKKNFNSDDSVVMDSLKTTFCNIIGNVIGEVTCPGQMQRSGKQNSDNDVLGKRSELVNGIKYIQME